jgi:integrase
MTPKEFDSLAIFVAVVEEQRREPFFSEDHHNKLVGDVGVFCRPMFLKSAVLPFRKIWMNSERCAFVKRDHKTGKLRDDGIRELVFREFLNRTVVEAYRERFYDMFDGQLDASFGYGWATETKRGVINLWLNTQTAHTGPMDHANKKAWEFDLADFNKRDARIGREKFEFLFRSSIGTVGWYYIAPSATAGSKPVAIGSQSKTAGKEVRQRRALTDEEIRRFLEAAGSRKPVYLTALNTGLRRSELAALQKGDCFLYGDNPYLKVRASTTKNNKAATIWLNEEVTAELKKLVQPGAALDEAVFETIPEMDQFRKDLAAAGIPCLDAQGRRADFHALRHTLATNLARCGVLPRVAMAFMRHSEMRLTNKTYTDAAHLPLAEAAEMLPKFGAKKWTQKRTHDSGAEGHLPSFSGALPFGKETCEPIEKKGDCHALTFAGAVGHKSKEVHPIGVEPVM